MGGSGGGWGGGGGEKGWGEAVIFVNLGSLDPLSAWSCPSQGKGLPKGEGDLSFVNAALKKPHWT